MFKFSRAFWCINARFSHKKMGSNLFKMMIWLMSRKYAYLFVYLFVYLFICLFVWESLAQNRAETFERLRAVMN